MSQLPLAPQRFKRPVNWQVSVGLIHDLKDRKHCRDCPRCQADLEKRAQDEAARVKEEEVAFKKLHQWTNPNHCQTCAECRATRDRHTLFSQKDARKKGIEASHEARSEWRAPLEVGLRTYQAFRAPNTPSSVLFLLPGKTSPVSPTRSPSPQVAAATRAIRSTPVRRTEKRQKAAPANKAQGTTLQQTVSEKTPLLSNPIPVGVASKSEPTETSIGHRRFVSSVPLATPRSARTTPLVFSTPRTEQFAVPSSPPSPSPAPRIPRAATPAPTSDIRRFVAGSNSEQSEHSEQSSRKRSRQEVEHEGSESSDCTPPPSIRRRTSPNLRPLGTSTGDASQQPSRKRAYSDLEQDDIGIFETPTGPRIPGQFSPGSLFIQDPETAVIAQYYSQYYSSVVMSMFDALSNLAGKAWTAASTISRSIGYAPTNNAGQQVTPNEARQSPKRRRTDETSSPALPHAQLEVNSEHDSMEVSSDSINGMVMVNGGEMFMSPLSSLYARSPLSSSANSASNAAKKALNRYPRTILEPRRRIPEARMKDVSELPTNDFLETTQEQTMPGSWVPELDEQTWNQSSDLSASTSSLGKWNMSSESGKKNSETQEFNPRGIKSSPKSTPFTSLETSYSRGAWVTSHQSKQSSAEVSEQTSSPGSNRSEQPESDMTRNGGISTTGRSDPEPKFKKRTDFFQNDEDLLRVGIDNLHLRPNDGKIQELRSQQEERKRLIEEKRIAEEKAREDERLRLEAEKWNAQLKGIGLRKAKRKWITELSEEWEQRVDDSMKKSNVTCAPPEAVTLTPRDFNRMIPAGQWLNDSCVQAALTELATAINKSAGRVLKQDTPKCVALGTFFWTTLRDKGPENKERMMKRTWGMTPVNFLDIDTIIMPINESSHWTFILIRPKRREVAYVDSFGSSGMQKLQKALGFIEVFLGPARWNPKEWQVLKDLHGPSQYNSWDCGMFVITNSLYIALGLDPNTYKEDDLILQRRKIAAVLLNGGFKGDFDLGDL